MTPTNTSNLSRALPRSKARKAAVASAAAMAVPVLAGVTGASARAVTATAGMWGEGVLTQADIAHIDSYLDDLGWDEKDLDVYGLFWEAGYSYTQLLELVDEWNVGEFAAKARAGRGIQSGDTSEIFQVLGEGPAAEFMTAEDIEAADMAAYEEQFGPLDTVVDDTGVEGQPVDYDALGWNEDDLDVYGLFWEAGYSYTQLLELAEAWNVGEFEAKARAARAIKSGDTSIIDVVIEEGPAAEFMTAEEIEAADMAAYEEQFGLAAADE